MKLMDILQLMGGLPKAKETQLTELKVGQIVSGVVLKALNHEEALLKINGASVRAMLQTKLEAGAHTLFQVQPESTGSKVVLKALFTSGQAVHSLDLKSMLNQLEITDSKVNRELIRQMMLEQLPITKANVQFLQDQVQQKPAVVPEQSWMQSAILAMKRGLPATKAFTQSLHAALFDKDLHQSLFDMQTLLQSQLSEGNLSGSLRALLQSTLERMDQIQQLSSSITAEKQDSSTTTGEAVHFDESTETDENMQSSALAAERNTSVQSVQGSGSTAENSEMRAAQPSMNVLRSAERVLADAVQLEQGRLSGNKQQTGQAEQWEQPEPSHKNGQSLSAPAQPQHQSARADQGSDTGHMAADSSTTRGAFEASSALGKVFRLLGLGHESRITKLLSQDTASARLTGLTDPASADQASLSPDENTLKGMLMQIAQHTDASHNLQQTAQQMVHHLTGQQLLMTDVRNPAMAYLQISIPLFDSSGKQTSSVLIQTRKGKNGQIDAANCRLLFDLQMQSLGETRLDVQIMNQGVVLNINSVFPQLKPMIEAFRPELEEQLHQNGYRLISLTTGDLNPVHTDQNGSLSQASGTFSESGSLRNEKLKDAQYKGVDYKV